MSVASGIRARSIPLQPECCWFYWDEQHVWLNFSAPMTKSTTRSFALVTLLKPATLLVLRCRSLKQQPDGLKIRLKVRWPLCAEISNRRRQCTPPKRLEGASFMNLRVAERRLTEHPFECAFMRLPRFVQADN